MVGQDGSTVPQGINGTQGMDNAGGRNPSRGSAERIRRMQRTSLALSVDSTESVDFELPREFSADNYSSEADTISCVSSCEGDLGEQDPNPMVERVSEGAVIADEVRSLYSDNEVPLLVPLPTTFLEGLNYAAPVRATLALDTGGASTPEATAQVASSASVSPVTGATEDLSLFGTPQSLLIGIRSSTSIDIDHENPDPVEYASALRPDLNYYSEEARAARRSRSRGAPRQ